MNNEEKEYIDKKFSDMENRFLSPDPAEMLQRSKKFRKFYFSYYLKWVVVALVATLGTMVIAFRVLGLW